MTSTTNTNSWTVLSDDDVCKRTDFICDVYQDRYIVIAGGIPQSAVIMYDVTKQSYITLPDLPDHGDWKGVVLSDYLYVFLESCGIHRICLSRRVKWESVHDFKLEDDFIIDMVTDGSHIYLVDWNGVIIDYNPSTNKLTPLKQSNHQMPRDDFFVAVVDSKIYIMGGSQGLVDHTATLDLDTNVYDIVTQSWSQAPPLPTPLCKSKTTTIDRWIVLTGGYRRSNYVMNNQIFVYNTLSQQWTTASAEISRPCSFHQCVKLGSRMIVVGGYCDDIGGCSPMKSLHIKHIIPDW